MTVWNLYDLGLKCKLPESFFPVYDLPEDIPRDILAFLTGTSADFPPVGNLSAYSAEGHSLNIVTRPGSYEKGVEGLIEFLSRQKPFQMEFDQKLNRFWRDEPMYVVHATSRPDIDMDLSLGIEIHIQAYLFRYQDKDLILIYTKSLETGDVEGMPLSILDSLEPLNLKVPIPEEWAEKEIDPGIKISVPKEWGVIQPNRMHKGVTSWSDYPPIVAHLFSEKNKQNITLDDILERKTGIEKAAIRTRINNISGIFKNIVFLAISNTNRPNINMRYALFNFIHKDLLITLRVGGPEAIWSEIANIVDRIIQSIKLEKTS